MKKIFAAVLLSCSVATPALAGDKPFYAGITLGSASLPVSSTTAFGIFAGYKFDKSVTPFMANVGTLAIEAQYTTLGSDTRFIGANTTFVADYSSFGVDAVAMFPIRPVQNLSVFGKLGFNNVNASASCRGVPVGFCNYSVSTGINLGIGAGAQYDFNRDFSARAGVQSYASSVSTIYAAGIYTF